MPVDEATREAVTAILAEPGSSGEGTMARLAPLIYDDLRGMAHRMLASERGPRTLVTTDLVHEAFLKLVDGSRVTARGRSYFYACVARAMRQILVDRARTRGRLKRGGDVEHVSLDGPVAAVDRFSVDILDLERALRGLARLNPRQVRVVECRYFGGMTVDETAEALGVSARTIKQDWALARAWLFSRLESSSGDPATDG